MTVHGQPAVGRTSRTAVFVDYENLYYENKAAFGPSGLKHLAPDLMHVASLCGPVTVALAIAPFDDFPGAAQAFHQAGFEPKYSSAGAIKNAADLLVVEHLAALDSRQEVGVAFLVSGDGHMLGALKQAQTRGIRVVVVAAEEALSPKLRTAADRVLSIAQVQAEASRLRQGKPGVLGLQELASLPATASAPAVDTSQGRSAAGHESSPSAVPPASAPSVAPPTPAPSAAPPVSSSPSPSTCPPPAPVPLQTSPTALKTFAQCPRHYAFVHVEKRKSPANRHTFLGNCVHAAIREFLALDRRRRSASTLEALLRRTWAASPERRQVFPVGSKAEEAAAGREALADLETFLRHADAMAIPVGVEVFGRTEVGEGVLVTGKIDRIDAIPKAGGLVITDYKTGKAPSARPSLLDEFQLPLYVAMVAEARAEAVEKVVLHYLKGNVRHEYRLGETDVRRAKERALGLARGIRTGDFPARVSPLCGWCSFRADCPSREAAEKLLASRKAAGGETTGATATSPGDLPF